MKNFTTVIIIWLLVMNMASIAQSKQPGLGGVQNLPNIKGRESFNGKTDEKDVSYMRMKDSTSVDSNYTWLWDKTNQKWPLLPYSKNILTYDTISNLLLEDLNLTWNGIAWVNTGLTNYTYNANKKNTIELYQSWSDSAWVNTSRDTFAYDSHDNMMNHFSQSWGDTAWVNNWQYIYTYDANNNLTSLELLYNPMAYDTWKEIYTYDTLNNETSQLYQIWTDSAWVDDGFYIYTYDAHNNKISQLNQIWSDTALLNNSLDTYTYDTNNHLTIDSTRFWNDTASWLLDYNSAYTYDANFNVINTITLYWNGTAWVNSGQSIYTYNSNNYETSLLRQNWNDTAWVNLSQQILTYDSNNNNTDHLTQTWRDTVWVSENQLTYYYDPANKLIWNAHKSGNGESNGVINGDSVSIYYTITGIPELTSVDADVNIYPNPATNQLTIHSSFHNETVTVSVMNMLGQIMQQENLKWSSDVSINISNLSAGMYLLEMKTESGSVVKRFVKE